MTLIATALVFLVANAFIQASASPVPPVAFTPQPNDLKGEGKQGNARFKRMEKYLDGPTKRPGWRHYENCMGKPCSLKRIYRV